MSGEAGILANLLPPGPCAADSHDDGLAIAPHPGEEHCVAGAGESRRRDFALGRTCARRALRRLGADAGAILRRADGAPAWPAGIVGSITHTRGYAAAAVAHATEFSGIGIDAERVATLAENVERRLFVSEERAWLESLEPEVRPGAAILLFSAKEAFFKACDMARLRFQDIRVMPGSGTMRVEAGDRQVEGRWAVAGDLLVTAIAVRAG